MIPSNNSKSSDFNQPTLNTSPTKSSMAPYLCQPIWCHILGLRSLWEGALPSCPYMWTCYCTSPTTYDSEIYDHLKLMWRTILYVQIQHILDDQGNLSGAIDNGWLEAVKWMGFACPGRVPPPVSSFKSCAWGVSSTKWKYWTIPGNHPSW